MKTRKILAAAAPIVLLAAGCASGPEKIDAAYVSPLKYKDYDCDQIAMEMDYVEQRTSRLYQSLKKEANADKWQMGVGLVLFWPALFALEGGDGPEAAEYSQLKGEYEALRQMSTQKKCGIESKSPDQIMEESMKKDQEEAEVEAAESEVQATTAEASE